jgi:futalosine hydrolase
VPGAVQGVIGTVAAASGSREEAAAWRARHPDVLVEEMEAHAVAAACARAGVPLAVLRAVCNECGDRELARWELQGAFAALNAALPAACAALAGVRT